MSTNLTVNLSLTDRFTAALVLIAGCGGTFAVVRRNWRGTRQADPEAIELHVTGVAEGSTVLGTAGDAEAVEETGEVDVVAMLDIAGGAEALEEIGDVDDGDHSEETCTADDVDASA